MKKLEPFCKNNDGWLSKDRSVFRIARSVRSSKAFHPRYQVSFRHTSVTLTRHFANASHGKMRHLSKYMTLPNASLGHTCQ